MTVSDRTFADLARRLADALIRFDCEYLAKDRDEIWRLQSELCAARHEELGAGGWPLIEKVLLNPPAMYLPPLSSIAT
jgi:hypothetical protein